jgi:hypothetical protein
MTGHSRLPMRINGTSTPLEVAALKRSISS